MKISLSREIERRIAEQVRSGRYRSADEVVGEGLELLQKRDKEGQRAPANGNESLAAVFESIARDVPAEDWEKVPADLSTNLDHYLYGGQKTR